MSDKTLYHCIHCNLRMRAKSRPGSRQFQEGARDNPDGGMVSAMTLNYMQAITCGQSIPDRGRKADPENWSGWEVAEEDSNWHRIWFDEKEGKFLPSGKPLWVRQEDGQDLEIRLTISDHPRDKQTALSALESWFDQVQKLTPMERKMYFCYLSGSGHYWEVLEEGPSYA